MIELHALDGIVLLWLGAGEGLESNFIKVDNGSNRILPVVEGKWWKTRKRVSEYIGGSRVIDYAGGWGTGDSTSHINEAIVKQKTSFTSVYAIGV